MIGVGPLDVIVPNAWLAEGRRLFAALRSALDELGIEPTALDA
jgi:hypothetical protein